MSIDWPYPRWIAHRGAGVAAPENTLAAFQLGYQAGFRMFECDAKLSADGVVFLLHDDTLDRTTNAHGMAHTHHWKELSQLDAGSWHSHVYKGIRLATLEQIAHFCIEKNCLLNIEIKPSPGYELITGEQVAKEAHRLWSGQSTPPLLTSFKRESLLGALTAAPHIPRGLLMHELAPDWRDATIKLRCDALACHFEICDQALMEEIHDRGLCSLAYTVNEDSIAKALLKLGIDSIITDNLIFGQNTRGIAVPT